MRTEDRGAHLYGVVWVGHYITSSHHAESDRMYTTDQSLTMLWPGPPHFDPHCRQQREVSREGQTATPSR